MKRQIATHEEIKSGKTTDIYFVRTLQILKREKIRKWVKAEIITKHLFYPEGWAVFAGLEDALDLLQKIPIHVKAIPEGTVFHPYEPVMVLEGFYDDFALYETPLLGMLCQASGVATKAARCRKAAGPEKTLLSFGTRRMHPAISPMLDRSAYVGGCDSVSSVLGAQRLGMDPVGTMPHSLVLLKGDTVAAAKSFDAVINPKVRRVALIDTFNDEKFEAVRVAEALGKKLAGVRLDTPSSRRGNFLQILREVRWELDLRGFQHVKILVSGGLDEHEIAKLGEVADGFGIGTSICNAPVVDLALDIIEIEGRPVAKRGKYSGAKSLWRCPRCHHSEVVPESAGDVRACPCEAKMENLLRPVLRNGKTVGKTPSPHEIRKRTLSQLEFVTLLPKEEKLRIKRVGS